MQKKYNLLAKRIFLDNPSDVIIDFGLLKTQLVNYNTQLSAGGVTASIYFQYLPTGSSIGINSNQALIGASLLKTPLAINLYKAAEDGKINLDSNVTLKKEWLDSSFGDLYKKGAGYQLTLRDAVHIMLRDSDNTAALAIYNTLAKIVPIDQILLSFVDAQYSTNKDKTIQIGAGSYSKIMQCLYFACYLTPNDSQQILQYLVESPYNNRLKLYLPDNLVVAHKIGEYDGKTQKIQSDCGIIYMPNRNYLLCVLLTGEDPVASNQIASISQIVYNYMAGIKINNK